MTDLEIVVCAVAVVLAAVAAIAVPWWVVAVVALLAVLSRRPLVVGVVLVLAASTLAARAEAGLVVAPRAVRGVADIVTDPEARPGGVVLEVRVAGRRYRTFAGADLPALAGAVVGERWEVRGRIDELRGPWSWRASRHLSGRLRLASAERVDGGAWWWRSADWMHRTVERGLDSFDPDGRALFLGVVLGDDRALSEVERFRFRSSGLSHLTAVSGQNVAFVLVAVGPVLRRLRLGPRWVLTLVVLGWFALLTRLEPSVLRAVSMAGVAATASWRGRYASGWRVVSIAVGSLVLVDPMLVWSLGFRLSVAATVSLVALARPLTLIMRGPRVLADIVAVSLAAQVGTAPLLLPLAGSVPVLGIVANVLAVPVAGWLMVWGVVTAPLGGVVGGSFADVLAAPSRSMVGWLSWVAARLADPALPRIGWIGVVGGVVAVGLVLLRSRAKVVVLAALLAVGAIPVDVALGGGDEVWEARGAALRVVQGVSVMTVGGAPDEGDALALLTQARVGRVDVVVVTSPSRSASMVVWDLRQVVDVGRVYAVDPSTVRDSESMPVSRRPPPSPHRLRSVPPRAPVGSPTATRPGRSPPAATTPGGTRPSRSPP